MKVLLLLLCLTVNLVHADVTGDTGGNSGDAIRLIFVKGKKHASNVVANINLDKMPIETDKKVKRFIEDNRYGLANDILRSAHDWKEQELPTCAHTLPQTESPITLSFQTCIKTINTPLQAGQLLIHESVHHFGVTEEAFADAVALAVYNTWEKSLVMGDLGYRWNPRKEVCENEIGEAGTNPSFPGECGDFSGKDLGHTGFEKLHLRGANFSFSDLLQTNFEGATLKAADFSFSHLLRSKLRGGVFDGADFSHAELRDLDSTNQNVTYFRHTKFRYAIVAVDYPYTDYSDSDFLGAQVSKTSAGGSCNYQRAVFTDAALRGRFYGDNFQGANFKNASLHGAYTQCNFSDAILDGADLKFADLRQADLRYRMETGSKAPEFSGACFDKETKLPFSEAEAVKQGMIKIENGSGCPLPREEAVE